MRNKSHNEQIIIHDLIGVGLGPFNLSLAALAEPIPDLHTLFFEQNSTFDWHPGMLLSDSLLQVPFLADLVTLANPTSPWSFLNYLHQHKRMYKFYFRENFHISRLEYNDYCQWVSKELTNLIFNHQVTHVEHIENPDSLLCISVLDKNLNQEHQYYSKHLVVGIGTIPYIPEIFSKIKSEYIQHSANFISFKNEKLKNVASICVIGSGQSAAEVVLELLNDYESHSRKIFWITRSGGFFPMEYSKLGLEHFSPEYMTYFHYLNDETRKTLIGEQNLMYKGISQKTITMIYEKLYQLTVANKFQPLQLVANSELQEIKMHYPPADDRFHLHFRQWQEGKYFQLDCDAIVLATGYQAAKPNFLSSLNDYLQFDKDQFYALKDDFSIKKTREIKNKIFVQNNSLFSHGIGSPDLGLGCYRNSVILKNVTKKEYYPIHPKNVFQTFHSPH